MADHPQRPLLFLDVDGTLLPFAGARLPSVPAEWDDWQDVSNPLLANIDLAHGPRLLALPCVLVWATAWMEEANEVISPLLGLPELPTADLPDAPDEYEVGALNWKTRALVRAAAGRPFVWATSVVSGSARRTRGSSRMFLTVAEVAEVHIHTARPSHRNHSGTWWGP